MITPHPPPPPCPGRNTSLYAYHWSLSFNLSKIYTLHPLQCSAAELTAHLGVLTVHSVVFTNAQGLFSAFGNTALKALRLPPWTDQTEDELPHKLKTVFGVFLAFSVCEGHSYILLNPSKMCLHSGSQSIFGNIVQVAEILFCPPPQVCQLLCQVLLGIPPHLCSGLIISRHVSVLCHMVKRSAFLLPFLHWRKVFGRNRWAKVHTQLLPLMKRSCNRGFVL